MGKSSQCLIFCAIILFFGVSLETQAQRDPLLWPFAQTSIWNMPLHHDAVYTPAGIGVAGAYGMTEDKDHIIFHDPLNPLQKVYEMAGEWDGREPHPDENVLFSAHIPDGYEYFHETHNNCFTVFLDDVHFVQAQPMQYVSAEGKWTTKYVWAPQSVYDDGIAGSHGGSGLSAIGGTIRLGELDPGSVIRHALKVNIFCALYAYFDPNEPDGKPGYRWPALSTDSGAGDSTSGNYYGGTNPEVQMGTLLALLPDFNLDTFRTEPARIIGTALRDYGAYVVDNTAWDVYGMETEEGPQGDVTQEVWDHYGIEYTTWAIVDDQRGVSEATWDWVKDMALIFTNLHAVANNTDSTIGGGPTTDHVNRRQELAPPFALTDVNEISSMDESFDFFPNPCLGDYIHFKEPVQAEIYDLHGHVLNSVSNAQFMFVPDKKGTYMVKVFKGDQVVVRRLVRL